MQRLGARVIPVKTGTQNFEDAINEAMRDWVTNVQSTHYVVGSAVGPHPLPDDRAGFSVGGGEGIAPANLAGSRTASALPYGLRRGRLKLDRPLSSFL